MSIIKLPNIVYPLQHLDKTNEIIDVVNSQLNTSYSESNPVLTSTEGVATWTVTHNLGTEEVSCTVYQGDNEVLADVAITSANVVTIKFNSASNISAETYSVLVLAKGGLAGAGGVVSVDSELSTTSLNPVQNKVVTTALNGKASKDLDNITNAGKVNIANVSLPSSTYTSLTLEASGTRYTAPADGYYQISKFSSAPYQQLYVTNTKFYISGVDGSNGVFSVYSSGNSSDVISALIPVCKGDKINIYYTLGGATASFKFIYAKGSESEYTP